MKKKFRWKSVVQLTVLILSLSFMLLGCTSTTTPSQNGVNPNIDLNAEVMTIGEYVVHMDDVYMYVIQYLYNNSIKADQLTSENANAIVNGAIEQMKLELVEYQLALQSDITLTEEQKVQIQNGADMMYNYFGAEFLAKYGITEEYVYNLFERQMYISCITNKAVQDLGNDYIAQLEEDYKDMVFHTVYYALFPSVKYDSEGNVMTDDDGNPILLSEEEMAEQMELAEAFRAEAVAGEKTMEELVEEYGISDFSGIERNYQGVYTEELNRLIESLSVGDISEVVATDSGYMIVRMDNDNDTDYKEYLISYVARQNADRLFPTLQENWVIQSGTANLTGDSTLLSTIDVISLCREMNEKGYDITGGQY